MMDVEYFRDLYNYTYWARDRLLKTVEGMSQDELWRPNGFNYQSIGGILRHCMVVERNWNRSFRGDPRERPPEEELTLADLTAQWSEEESRQRAYLAGLTDEGLQGVLHSRRRDIPLWQALGQVVNHSTQHRAEAAEALTMVGRSPGDLDLIEYYNEQAPPRESTG